jgi:hypothetical protein
MTLWTNGCIVFLTISEGNENEKLCVDHIDGSYFQPRLGGGLC